MAKKSAPRRVAIKRPATIAEKAQSLKAEMDKFATAKFVGTPPSKRPSIKELLAGHAQVALDVGGGENPHPGAINMDIRDLPSVHIVHDIEAYPWPLPDSCIDLLIASHVVEHIDPARGNFVRWMAEAWRVLKPGGQFLISYPYAGSPGFWQDPTHCNGCSERTWTYWDPHHPNRLFSVYRPKPFHIVSNEYQVTGNAEVRLAKLKVQPEFGCLETQPYTSKK